MEFTRGKHKNIFSAAQETDRRVSAKMDEGGKEEGEAKTEFKEHGVVKREVQVGDDVLELEGWVDSLLEAEFYVQCECGSSTKGETNLFCTECKGKAFCEKCRLRNGRHTDHKVIQVYKSSHATCFRKNDIKRMMNISLIQSFINNSHYVIYIRPRKSNGHRNGVQPVNRCVICLWELKNVDDLYCSISCKVNGIKSQNSCKKWNHCNKRRKGSPVKAPHNYGVQSFYW